MHVSECEDRAGFDLFKYNIAPKVESAESHRPPVAEPKYVPLPESEENWDDVSIVFFCHFIQVKQFHMLQCIMKFYEFFVHGNLLSIRKTIDPLDIKHAISFFNM